MKKIAGFLFLLFFASACEILQLPRIYSITPDRGPVGTQVTIQGTRFGNFHEDKVALYFGGVTTPVKNILFWSDSKIIASVPENAKSGRVVVEVNGKKSIDNVTFTVLHFAPIKVPAIVWVLLDNGEVNAIKGDPEKGFYIDTTRIFTFRVGNEKLNGDLLIPVKNSNNFFLSGWIEKNGTTKYFLFLNKNYSSFVSSPVEVSGPVIDAIQKGNNYYLLDFMNRSVIELSPSTLTPSKTTSLLGEMPFGRPFRIFYSSTTSDFVVFTKPVFDVQNGEMIFYDKSFSPENSYPLPFIKIYDIFPEGGNNFLLTGWNEETPIIFKIPVTDPSNLYSWRIDGKIANGFAPSPVTGEILFSDPVSSTVEKITLETGAISSILNSEYSKLVSSPTMIRSMKGFDYIFVKSEDNMIVVIDTTIDAVYGTFQFPDNIRDFIVGIEGGKE